MEIFLLAAITCFVIITLGYVMHRYLQLPWMFTVVVFGMLLSSFGLFQNVLNSQEFRFLAKAGMLFFLFTIGLDLDLKEVRKMGGLIIGGNILLTLTEGLLIGLFLYFIVPSFVSYSFPVALLCGIAFGTVGEVLLLAILKEFDLEKTKFGQLALGIGVFDDVFEILALAAIVALPAFAGNGTQSSALQNALRIVLALTGIIIMTVLLSFVGKHTRRFFGKFSEHKFIIPFTIFLILFAYIYFGSVDNQNLGVVAAIFGGIAVKQILPENLVQQYKKPLYFTGNIFLGPFFFLSLGGSMSLSAVLTNPLIILSIMTISLLSRMFISFILFHKILGNRPSLVMGVGLTTKFSTSVISQNLLFSSGMITQPLYSAIMAAYILLKPIIVGVFSKGLAMTKDEIKPPVPIVPGFGVTTDQDFAESFNDQSDINRPAEPIDEKPKIK